MLNFNFDFRFAREMPREGMRAKFILCSNSSGLDLDRMDGMRRCDNVCKVIPKSVKLDGIKWKKVTQFTRVVCREWE